jgi:hypothetical protein
MWPNARISVMGGEQAASVLATVRRDGLEARGEDWSAEDEEAFKDPDPRDQYETQGTPTTRPPGCGTTGSSTRPRPATCSGSASPPRSTPRSTEKVVIAGELEGNVESAKQVELLSGGVLAGDLKAGALTVAAGARMRGQVEFGWDDNKPGKARENGAAA